MKNQHIEKYLHKIISAVTCFFTNFQMLGMNSSLHYIQNLIVISSLWNDFRLWL